MLTLNPISGAFDMVGLTQTSADARYVRKSGDIMTGSLSFSGTTNPGLQLNSLTTTQRDALTPANGMLLYNSTATQVQKYENSQWVDVSKSPATKVVAPAGSGYAADYYTTGSSDSSALQIAFTAASGGSLYVRAGTYDIDTTINLPSNIKIITDGWNTIFRMKNNSNTSCMTNSNHSGGNTGIFIYGLQIDMNATNNTTMTASQGINFTNVTDSNIDEVYIHDIRHVQGQENVAIGMNKTYNCVIRNNKIFNVGDYGIATNGIQYCKVINNHIQNPAGHGISLEHGDIGGSNERATENIVSGNTVYYDANETLNTQQGIKIGTIDNSIISNNTFYCTNKNGGIGITSAETTPGGSLNTNYQRGNVISNNTIYGFLIGGIRVVGSQWDSITGNTITLPYVAASSTYGISLDISLQSGDTHISEEVQVTGNTIIEETNSTLTSNSGIIVQDGSDFINISGNIINNISNTGITLLSGVNYIKISNNIIKDSARSSIILGSGGSSGSSYCQITNNTLSGGSRNANATYSDIVLNVNSIHNKIANNDILTPNANVILYGISEVDSTCDYNNIFDNFVQSTTSGTDINLHGIHSLVQGINAYGNQAFLFSAVGSNGANIVLDQPGTTSAKKFIRTRNGKFQIIDSGYGNTLLTIQDAGQAGLYNVIVPTAMLHLPAGTSAVRTAPLKFTSGVSLTTPEDGAIEYDGSHYYGTIGATRYQLDQQSVLAGDIVGPASAVNNNVVFFDGTTGKLVKDSGLTLSGSNTGDQTITLTGNVTGSGTGSFATTIASGVVTNAMLAGSIAASKLVGTDIATVGTITSGTWTGTTIAVANGGTGQTSYTDGQLLIGNTTGNTLAKATLTGTSNQITVTNGNGSITLATPQNIHTGASPTFVGLTLSGASVFTSASNANVVPLTINQNDTTNNPRSLVINHTGSGIALDIETANFTPTNASANLRIFTTESQATDKGGSLQLGGYSTGTTVFTAFGGIAGRKENATDTNTRGYLGFYIVQAEKGRFTSDGDFLIGGAGPTSGRASLTNFGFVTTATKTIGMERIVTSNTAGTNLTILAQGASSGATNKSGGTAILKGGVSTGSGTGQVQIQVYPGTAASTTDNTAITAMNFNGSGLVSTYGNISTVSNGIPSEIATIDSTGLTANVGATTLYTTPSSAGMYRVSAYVVETTAGSLSSTLPNVQIVYTDSDSNTSVTIDATPVLGVAGIGQTGALTANTVGTVSTGVIVLYVKASTTIQYQTVNYASNLSGMTYALRIKLEAL